MKNAYEIRGETTAIILISPTYGRMEAVIDTEDLEKVKSITGTWGVNRSIDTGTFYCRFYGAMKGKRTLVHMHRLVTSAPDGMVVDHINHDPLDNRKSNLRILTNDENMQNRRGAHKNSKSGIRGVHWNKHNKKWAASIRINGKLKHLGYFSRIEDAERSAIEARKRYMKYSKESEEAGA